MNTTQQHLAIADIKDNLLLLKNGGGALVLQVSAVNFGLLSDREQIGIISSFAQMLNSLSFSIQIVIYSERLNITSYLNLLDKAQQAQINPLLASMIGNYKQFIQKTIKENDVLDKKFFLIIPLYALELGLSASKESLETKIRTVLLPRRDQIIRQLNRVGLKATQLSNQKLIELFYNIYNGQFVENIALPITNTSMLAVNLKAPYQNGTGQEAPKQNITEPTAQPQSPIQTPVTTPQPASAPSITARASRTHPFVVEELDEKV